MVTKPLLPAFNTRTSEVHLLQSTLPILGHYIPDHELSDQFFGVGTQEALRSFQSKAGIRVSGEVDEATVAALKPAVEGEELPHRLEGRVLLESGAPAEGLRLRIYQRRVGGAVRLAEMPCDMEGFYLD